MTPVVRGRAFSATESCGRAKRCLDVLLWMNGVNHSEARNLDDIEVLREYLASIHPAVCSINLYVPQPDDITVKQLGELGIRFSIVPFSEPSARVTEVFKGSGLERMDIVAATALACDAGLVVVREQQWFPYVNEFDKLGILLTDTGVLKIQCEIFVRGHDVPWAFDDMAWRMPWTAFYQMAELRTFRAGLDFLYQAHRKKLDTDTSETARMLIHNRLPNLCFTRDRLLFYEMQQSAARRAGWKRQEFSFEAAYYLNFYYLLIYGGFDHVATVVNGALK